jgi:uncharacterized membrane protein
MSVGERSMALPRSVGPARVLAWLRAGWRDFLAVPGASAAHGLVFLVGALLILAIGWRSSGLLAGAFSGFVLVGPILVTGFYELSRRLQTGERATSIAVLDVWRRRRGRLLGFGALLALIGSGWVGFSVALVHAMGPGAEPGVIGFLRQFAATGNTELFLVWCMTGGMTAAIVFAISAVSVPMLVDRDVSLREAIHASVAAVGQSPAAMGVWAAVVMALTLVGFVTLVGLVVVLPVLGHAAWHAYCELIDRGQA